MNTIIEKIHHDINTAYLNRFQTCSETIDRESIESDKYDIAKLGFKSYESEIEKSEKIKASKEYIEIVNRLKIDYPYKKFITYDQIGKILEKYPLVLNTPERFIGKIPNNNIKDILNFKLKTVDEGYSPMPNIITYLKETKEINYIKNIIEEIINIVSERDFMPRFSSLGYDKDDKESKLITLKNKTGDIFNEITQVMGIKSDSFNCKSSFVIRNYYFKLDRREYGTYVTSYSLKNSDYDVLVTPVESDMKPQFWILATQDQFDVKSSEIVVGGKILEVGAGESYITLKDDPIIFKPIKEGLIVVTQWGDEAKLPEFTNSNNN